MRARAGTSQGARSRAHRRARAAFGVALALALAVAPGGCRATGVAAADFFAWGSSAFAPNPVASVPFHGGLAIGFVAGLPLCLISWPLAALLYPEGDEGEFYRSAALAPSLFLGTFVGTVLAAPLSPLGLPFVPDEPPPPPGPARPEPETPPAEEPKPDEPAPPAEGAAAPAEAPADEAASDSATPGAAAERE